MAESQVNAKDLVMGRADVLFRFLQLIGKDRPTDLEPYLEDLDDDTEHRPLVDQIVDRIISGDEALYEKYAQARREVGSRNPYSSVDEPFEGEDYARAFGYFMTRWVKLETIIRDVQQTSKDERLLIMPTSRAIGHLPLPKGWLQEIDYVRRLRNNAVHGVETPDPDQLFAAGKFIDEVLVEIEKLRNNKPETPKNDSDC